MRRQAHGNEAGFILRIEEARICLQIAPQGALPPHKK